MPRPRVLITAGPTREPLDPVRFLSNASTGAQGVALSAEALRRGYAVDLVHGPLEVPPPRGARLYPVETAREMLEACQALHPRCAVVIGAAAVSDYRPLRRLRQKRRRGNKAWTLALVPNEDILERLGRKKGGRVHAGFALESGDLVASARRKLHKKRLDWIVANRPDAIGASSSRYLLIGSDGAVQDLGKRTKASLARALFDAIEASPGFRERAQARPGACR